MINWEGGQSRRCSIGTVINRNVVNINMVNRNVVNINNGGQTGRSPIYPSIDLSDPTAATNFVQ